MRDFANAVGGGKFVKSGNMGGASTGDEGPLVKVGLVGDRAESGDRGEVLGPSRGLTGGPEATIESPLGLLTTVRAAACVFLGVVGVVATLRGLEVRVLGTVTAEIQGRETYCFDCLGDTGALSASFEGCLECVRVITGLEFEVGGVADLSFWASSWSISAKVSSIHFSPRVSCDWMTLFFFFFLDGRVVAGNSSWK